MNFLKFLTIIIILVLLNLCQAQNNEDQNDQTKSNNDDIIFNSNKTSCAMYTDNCEVFLLVKNSISDEINQDSLMSTNLRTFSIDSVELIDTTNVSIIQESSFENYTLDNYKIYLIKLKPGIVGFDYLVLIKSNLSHYVVISEPRRVIDKIFDVYIKVFQVSISLLMGILLDMSALYKLAKIPIPIAVGFVSQYLIMPLISFGFVKLIGLSAIECLAVFVYGCSPGICFYIIFCYYLNY
jgi:hypothetical protein